MSYGLLQRWRPSTRSAFVLTRTGPDRRVFVLADIERGWTVLDCAGRRIGRVHQTGEATIVVERGLFATRLAVPVSTVAEVHEGRLSLNVSLAWVLAPDRGRAL